MAKKLLFHFDTDPMPSVFDTVVAYDGGADHVHGYGGVTPDNVSPLVAGTIFTRGDKKNSAIFVSGSNMQGGEDLFEAVISASRSCSTAMAATPPPQRWSHCWPRRSR
jgi:methylenetetrahydrofolate/methylenetetrahydromethanopterin dehydrogenase (NADP+)